MWRIERFHVGILLIIFIVTRFWTIKYYSTSWLLWNRVLRYKKRISILLNCARPNQEYRNFKFKEINNSNKTWSVGVKFDKDHDRICETRTGTIKDLPYIKNSMYAITQEAYMESKLTLLELLSQIIVANLWYGGTLADTSGFGLSSAPRTVGTTKNSTS